MGRRLQLPQRHARYAFLEIGLSTDLSPLLDRPALEQLDLQGEVGFLQPLAHLPHLRQLSLLSDRASPSLEPLEDAPSLEALELAILHPSQVSALARMKRLRHLTIRRGAAHLRGVSLPLESLTLAGEAPPLDALAGLARLTHLTLPPRTEGPWALLGALPLTHLTAPEAQSTDLRGLPATLTSLTLDGSALLTLDGAAALPHLAHLSLNHTAISQLTPLAGAQHLQTLRAHGTRIEALDGLSACQRLSALYLEKSRLSSLEGVRELPALTTLWAYATRLTRLSPLEAHPTIEELNLGALRRVEDHRALLSLPRLARLEPPSGLPHLIAVALQERGVTRLHGAPLLPPLEG